MTYKPVMCEIKLLKGSIIPSIKSIFTDKRVFLYWIMLSAPYYLLDYFGFYLAKYMYLILLGVVLISIIHEECIEQ